MQCILIAESSEEYRVSLTNALQREYRVVSCGNGMAAAGLLSSQRFDALVLDLLLPDLDGLSLLSEHAAYLPKNILALSSMLTPFVQQRLRDLGVDDILMKPCSIRAVSSRLSEMLLYEDAGGRLQDSQAQAGAYLQGLGFPTKLDGYQQLRIGIPLFAQNRYQSMSKELYPAVAELCGLSSQTQVERSIRSAIRSAWLARKSALWDRYFPPEPGEAPRWPSNKAFISRMAQLLKEE